MNSKQKDSYCRVANVGYLNSVAYRAVRDLPSVTYSECEPSVCARMLHEDECDLACIPIAEYFNHGGYSCLPFGIVATGPVESVKLFSTRPLECLDTVIFDSSSQASVILFRILLEELCPQQAKAFRFLRMPAEESLKQIGNETGALIIGDAALQYRGIFPYELDLAESWNRCTGVPFVFAVWAYRPSRLQLDCLRDIEAAFKTGVEESRSKYACEWAVEHGTRQQEAVRYVEQRISYHLNVHAIQGALEFLRRGIALGFFPQSSVDRLRLDFEGKNSHLRKTARIKASALDRLLEDASLGRRISIQEGMLLATEASFFDLALAADLRRKQLHPGGGVSYIIDRNINYTNFCNVYCRFCAFYRAPGKEDGYLLTKEEIGRKIEETIQAGGIQILLQGGLNPDLGIEYYEDLFRWIKDHYEINLHALSADEIAHIGRVSKLSVLEVLRRLIASGLGSLPGGGAEILVDRVRRRIARLKTTASEWLQVHRSAHSLGLISTCTMMFGVKETWEDRILHLYKLRQLQDETRGFTAFIAWPFQDQNTKLKRGDTSSLEYLRVQAVARLFLDNIQSIQSSWVTQGPAVGQAALFFGANDFGSVMFEENVVSSAGTTYSMDTASIEQQILEAGFWPWRRDVHYQRQFSCASGHDMRSADFS